MTIFYINDVTSSYNGTTLLQNVKKTYPIDVMSLSDAARSVVKAIP